MTACGVTPSRGILVLVVTLFLVSACATSPPADVDDLCKIFDDKRGWYDDARDAEKSWGSAVAVMMAIIHQESRFVANAKPPRKKILGFIPGPRPSDSYGYSQALESTWNGYKRSAGRYGADRDDFGDAIDFVGWYNNESYRRNGIQKNDAYRLYLAYHEGHGGYERGTFHSKDWLLGVARKVSDRSARYERQLNGCRERLEKGRGWFGWF
ncbi:transglycosylase SLT domain-containing protein [Congregibacter sp.]|uniref:transglycosylase SLT domain-containing protein n=1 Tax=Congregibacter sp. TaxID=2744308 RepID=UPI003F6DA3E1